MSISGIYNSAVANTQINENAFTRTRFGQSSGSAASELPSDVATFQSLNGAATTGPAAATLTPVQLAYQSFQQLRVSATDASGPHAVTNDPKVVTTAPSPNQPDGIDPKSNDPRAIGPTIVSPTGIDPKTNDPKAVGPTALPPDGIDPKSNDPRAIGPTIVSPTGSDGVDPITNDPRALGVTAIQLPVMS
jgi:hypothetical protein